MCRPVRSADKQVGGAVAIILADSQELLSSQRVKRISDRDLARQNSGIMYFPPIGYTKVNLALKPLSPSDI
jgi:hypothetical protein